MLKHLTLFALFGLAVMSSTVTSAEEQGPSIAFYGGTFEAFDSDNRATEIGLEYRFSPQAAIFDLRPTLGLAITSDGSYWGYGGVRYDWYLSPKWRLTPHAAVAAYEKGAGLDLGYDMVFRLGVDLGYQLTDHSRLELGIHHMSNAYIDNHNPGSESVIFTYSSRF